LLLSCNAQSRIVAVRIAATRIAATRFAVIREALFVFVEQFQDERYVKSQIVELFHVGKRYRNFGEFPLQVLDAGNFLLEVRARLGVAAFLIDFSQYFVPAVNLETDSPTIDRWCDF